MIAGRIVRRWTGPTGLACGLMLFAFTTTHLINHAFGLVSFETAEQMRRSALGFWHWTFLGLLLPAALVLHVAINLYRLARRRSLRMPAWQYLQLGLGLAIPFWLVVHMLATRGLSLVHGTQVNYYLEFFLLWPGLATQQIVLTLLVWTHGCMGIHFWLRLRPLYRRLQPFLLAFAVLLPTLAITGFVSGGRGIHEAIRKDASLLDQWKRNFDWVPLNQTLWVYDVERIILLLFGVALLAVATVHASRYLLRWKNRLLRITYDDGTKVSVPAGTSVLEASRIARLGHASVCGGRGRCSTCRVRVRQGKEFLPPPNERETRVLERLGAAADVRLACQLRPTGDIAVTRLMAATVRLDSALMQMNPAQGVEREIAVLFADLRGFTQLSEGRMPFDVVFLLNRYFNVMGKAIEIEGGTVDKFIGDGIMALFGLNTSQRDAARQALAAARRMGDALATLNTEFEADLPRRLKMGIGIHFGPAIVGELGYGRATSITAIGDTVNVASRLEAATKELGAELIVSDELLRRAELEPENGRSCMLEVRGRNKGENVRAFDRAVDLPAPGLAAIESAKASTGLHAFMQLFASRTHDGGSGS
ncbi:MAG: adenylate/guanylate cyclase domain-containing protein [Geminicoccaceae bacterium]|nr:adenylate/guanylate cyclase domain-containing protein [Geminicoccaceae bacterium]